LAVDHGNDLAVLEIARPQRPPLRIARTELSGPLSAGGFGGDGRYRAITGPVVGYSTALGARSPSLRIRGQVRGGDSGGPVLNRSGELVGVVWGVRSGTSYAMFGQPLKQLLARIQSVSKQSPEQSQGGLIAVEPRNPTGPLHDAQRRVEQRLAAIESLTKNCRPCPCTGECVRQSQLQGLAKQSELQAAGASAKRQHEQLLARLGQIDASSADKARQAALDAVNEKFDATREPRPSLSTVQLVAGALGIGGPAGVAILAGGWLARRRVKKRLRRRGLGGPRHGPFRP